MYNPRMQQAVPFPDFPQFPEPELQRELRQRGRLLHFSAGQSIQAAGDYIRMIPLIISGSLKVSRSADDGSELFLYYLEAGESCTMTFSCCLTNQPSEVHAVAETDTSILALPRQVIDEWMPRYRSWRNFVLTSYDRRMRELVQTIDDVSFHQLDDRLLGYLGKRAEQSADGAVHASHREIAEDLHVSREAISRLLKGLERHGRVTLARNRISLREV